MWTKLLSATIFTLALTASPAFAQLDHTIDLGHGMRVIKELVIDGQPRVQSDRDTFGGSELLPDPDIR
jgi:hypothetical protein